MKMQVHIISTETIKPSSSTPKHHRNYNLSFLDHLIPDPYAPIVLYYPSNNNYTTINLLLTLKQSLSETLTRFYPFAGTIKDDGLSIDCNDRGANFVHTQVNCHLRDFLDNPDLLLIHKFLPCELILKETSTTEEAFVSNFQVNVFQCGGIAIGVCISHKVLDGAALSMFVTSWSSAAARGHGSSAILPNTTATSLFPKNSSLQDLAMLMWGSFFKLGKCKTRRFVFDSLAITNLKARATTKQAQIPSRTVLVSGFLWMCMMNASEKIHASLRQSFITHLVNLRPRIASVSSLENSIGNLLWIAPTIRRTSHEKELYKFVREVRAGTTRIDKVFIERLTSDKSKTLISDSLKEISEMARGGGVDCYGFSSMSKSQFYEADFGWGKPIWLSSYGMDSSVFMNRIILTDTIKGDGIEAWVTLDEQEMNVLVKNDELLQLALVDPSPLVISAGSKPVPKKLAASL